MANESERSVLDGNGEDGAGGGSGNVSSKPDPDVSAGHIPGGTASGVSGVGKADPPYGGTMAGGSAGGIGTEEDSLPGDS